METLLYTKKDLSGDIFWSFTGTGITTVKTWFRSEYGIHNTPPNENQALSSFDQRNNLHIRFCRGLYELWELGQQSDPDFNDLSETVPRFSPVGNIRQFSKLFTRHGQPDLIKPSRLADLLLETNPSAQKLMSFDLPNFVKLTPDSDLISALRKTARRNLK